jgi:hypothetical protein
MTRLKALLAGTAVAAIAAVSVAAVSAAPGQAPAGGDTTFERPMHGHGHMHMARGDGHGWRGHHGGPRDCDRAGGPMQRQIGVIEGLMEFTPAQKTAWAELKTAIDSGKETFKKACEARKDGDKPKNAIERFNRHEEAMSTRLAVMKTVKPAFEKFYGTLNEKQQKTVDDMFTRGRRG